MKISKSVKTDLFKDHCGQNTDTVYCKYINGFIRNLYCREKSYDGEYIYQNSYKTWKMAHVKVDSILLKVSLSELLTFGVVAKVDAN